MRIALLPQSLLGLLAISLPCQAQLIEKLSFGHLDKISPDGSSVPGWSISSVSHHPQILSDRIFLTPPAPGNTRGALWADSTMDSDTWTAELVFRTMGQDGGSGNLQLWYVKDKSRIETDSVHTVQDYDGMALLVDKFGGSGGSIRGFLNDGKQNYRSHSNVESLAFANCAYNYRNLGLPSTIKVVHNNGLTVTVDGRDCFSSDKISLPRGNYFGITAAAADIPDSFEIVKFTVSNGGAAPPVQQQQQTSPNPDAATPGTSPQLQRLDKFPGAPEAVPDKPAEEIKTDADQFADLHNRLQGLTHQMANLFGEFSIISSQIDERHSQLLAAIPTSIPAANTNNNPDTNGGAPSASNEALMAVNRRLEGLERTLEQIRRDVEGKDYRETLNQLNRAIENVRGGLTDSLPDTISGIMNKSAPRTGLFVFIIVAGQVLLAASYIIYKRRRNSMPKKYL